MKLFKIKYLIQQGITDTKGLSLKMPIPPDWSERTILKVVGQTINAIHPKATHFAITNLNDITNELTNSKTTGLHPGDLHQSKGPKESQTKRPNNDPKK